MKYPRLTRVLALDLHPRRFGYAVLEGSARLLDWGVRTSRHRDKAADALISAQLRPLLELWQPTLLVVGECTSQTHKSRERRCRLLKRIAKEAGIRRIAVRTLKKISTADESKKITKYENARRIAEYFSVLRWKMPPKRRAWESEDYRMRIFTAATLAIAQLNITNSSRAPSSPQACR